MYGFGVLVVFGYESHDDYIETGEWLFDFVSSDEVWNMAQAYEAATQQALAWVDEDRGWWRVQTIEAYSSSEPLF